MDLNNINFEDIKEKFLKLDRKTLIKFGIGFGSLIVFLIIYLAILKPIVDEKKNILKDQTVKLKETKKFKNEIKKLKKKIKKVTPDYKKNSSLFHSKAEVEDLYDSLSVFATNYNLQIIKFKRAIAKSKKMLNFDEETIKVDKTSGKIISTGQLTIVGLPNEFD